MVAVGTAAGVVTVGTDVVVGGVDWVKDGDNFVEENAVESLRVPSVVTTVVITAASDTLVMSMVVVAAVETVATVVSRQLDPLASALPMVVP